MSSCIPSTKGQAFQHSNDMADVFGIPDRFRSRFMMHRAEFDTDKRDAVTSKGTETLLSCQRNCQQEDSENTRQCDDVLHLISAVVFSCDSVACVTRPFGMRACIARPSERLCLPRVRSLRGEHPVCTQGSCSFVPFAGRTANPLLIPSEYRPQLLSPFGALTVGEYTLSSLWKRVNEYCGCIGWAIFKRKKHPQNERCANPGFACSPDGQGTSAGCSLDSQSMAGHIVPSGFLFSRPGIRNCRWDTARPGWKHAHGAGTVIARNL